MQQRLHHGRFRLNQRVISSSLVTDEASVIQRFEALLEEARPPTGGIRLADIAAEATAVLPLLTELPPQARAKGDYESFEFRECFTVLSLLGRRLALLDLTPTAATRVVQLALHAVTEDDELPVDAFAQHALAAAFEGFVMGREERVAQTASVRAAKPLKPIRIDDAVFALIITGAHEPEVLTDCVDRLGRAMLDAGAQVAIVDLTQIAEPNAERAIAIFAADEVTRMLGGVCLFTGLDSQWNDAAAQARIPLDALHIVPSFGEALEAARLASGRTARFDSRKWRALLDRLR